MSKTKLRDMPVLYIHIENGAKQRLQEHAERMGLQLTTFCRMTLLEKLESLDREVRNNHAS